LSGSLPPLGYCRRGADCLLLFFLPRQIWGEAAIQTVVSDDNSAGGRNAKVTFTVTRGSLYHIAATTSGSSPETGSYTLVYSNALGTLYSDPATKANLRRMQLLKK